MSRTWLQDSQSPDHLDGTGKAGSRAHRRESYLCREVGPPLFLPISLCCSTSNFARRAPRVPRVPSHNTSGVSWGWGQWQSLRHLPPPIYNTLFAEISTSFPSPASKSHGFAQLFRAAKYQNRSRLPHLPLLFSLSYVLSYSPPHERSKVTLGHLILSPSLYSSSAGF